MATEIKKVAVLGAGLMGTGIAAHLANAGIPSVLFDIVPNDAKDSSNPSARNAFALKALKGLVKSKPPQLMKKDLVSLITPANYDDHGALLADCDWIVEVVVERLDIKKHVFKWVAENRKHGSIVASNTSSIPLAQMADGMPAEMRENFVITHFFNPVRYMRLLELVDGPDTNPEVLKTLAAFGSKKLGKGIVFAKDTPAFVGNRIGTYAIGSVFKHMGKHGLSIEAVDSIFGPAMGRPKTAVFKLGDLVGLDTLGHVFHVIHDNCPDDEERDVFSVPTFLQQMIDAGATGRKAGAGFYKMVREGKTKNILVIDTETGEYREQNKPRFASVGAARKASTLNKKLQALVYGDDAAAKMAWDVTADLLNYSAKRVPEIADDVWNIDNGMRWGFSWDVGPFESWDLIGVRKSVEKMEAEGRTVAPWVKAMLEAGRESFYERDAAGNLTMWKGGESVIIERAPRHLFLSDLKKGGKRIDNNVSAGLYDLGDGILGLEFHSKMNALDEAIFDQYENALDKLDNGEFKGLVVGNQDGKAFCAGANILMILMGAMQGEWDTIEASIKRLQTLMMRAKYSPNPVVTAPYGLTLGGGAEVAMHSSSTVAAGELYMGLVEAGVGLVPAGGGTKELIFRALRDIPQDIDYDPNPFVQKTFQRIGLANVTSSGLDAQASGYLRRTDTVVMDIDALLGVAKQRALGLADSDYTAPEQRTIKLPGTTGAAAIELFLYQMVEGGMASEHDALIGKKLANILCGGDIPFGTARTEWDLLDLEREAFLSLAGEAKSQARMQAMLQTGKPLRN